jgi:hypothetical protein
MKIGILTLPLHHNYGGILQAYALRVVLQRMGHEAFYIFQDRKYRLPWWRYPLAYGKRILLKYMLGKKDIHIFQERISKKQDSVIKQNIRKFTDKYIEPYILRCSPKEMQKYLDAIVVGSDQIWRPLYYPNIQRAYLDFTKKWNIKRIAYAASFGVDQWEYSPRQTKRCAKLIKKFDAVSVREDAGVRLCDEYFNVEAQHVLDPVMLLDKEDYIKIIEESDAPRSKGTLCCYILDKTKEKGELIGKIANEKGLVAFDINSRAEERDAPLEERIQLPVGQWLRGFYDAELVITDSFHACVFSVLFNKPFLVILNTERGASRIISFLTMLHLEDRLITGYPTGNIDEIHMKRINYEDINVHIEWQKKKSMFFLTNCI